jgi:membrane dipeptidase
MLALGPWTDHRQDPAGWASALGISRAAVDLYLASEVIDLHLDTFIWTRLFGYDLTLRHGLGPTGGRFLGQADLPRLREAQLGGGIFSITTNPLRSASGRAKAFSRNLPRLKSILESAPEQVAIVRSAKAYRAARARGLLGAFLGIQGGNAVDAEGALGLIDDDDQGLASVVRVTLVHLSSSSLGGTSSPLGSSRGLTEAGRAFVQELNRRRIFADLAHASRQGFWDALEAHDRSLPAIVTHTGVSSVTPHWRNLDDMQIRAIANSGGVVGVMYQSTFLGDPLFAGRAESIVRHLEHVVRIGGEQCPALGSDFDGLIVPPKDLPSCLELPRLVEAMLARGFSERLIRGVLGENFLRSLELLRG